MDQIGIVLFALAILHTFSISLFQRQARKYPEGSVLENLFHLLGEVETVFGLWAGVLCLFLWISYGPTSVLVHLNSLSFTEPLFLFAVMVVASTRPIVTCASWIVDAVTSVLPVPSRIGAFFALLAFGPLLGGFITEPGAMTLTALLLKDRFFDRNVSQQFRYLTLGVLFVNVSIGGVLTHFAAPPVVMVAQRWGWGLGFMFFNFGWKAIVATLVNTGMLTLILRKELTSIESLKVTKTLGTPGWITILHLAFLGGIVAAAHHAVVFMGLFMFFLGVVTITKEYQEELRIRESLLVAFFLAGLVVFGPLQQSWLEPLIRQLGEVQLFVGSTFLTAITDNAALTYLGSQVEGILDSMKYALVAGAVAGGGLTIIANAPNPAGFNILQKSFGEDGINPVFLFLAALPPTLIAMASFWLL